MIAHVAGAPLEELVLPFLATGGAAVAVAVRMALRGAVRRGPRRSRHERAAPTDPGARDRSGR